MRLGGVNRRSRGLWHVGSQARVPVCLPDSSTGDRGGRAVPSWFGGDITGSLVTWKRLRLGPVRPAADGGGAVGLSSVGEAAEPLLARVARGVSMRPRSGLAFLCGPHRWEGRGRRGWPVVPASRAAWAVPPAAGALLGRPRSHPCLPPGGCGPTRHAWPRSPGCPCVATASAGPGAPHWARPVTGGPRPGPGAAGEKESCWVDRRRGSVRVVVSAAGSPPCLGAAAQARGPARLVGLRDASIVGDDAHRSLRPTGSLRSSAPVRAVRLGPAVPRRRRQLPPRGHRRHRRGARPEMRRPQSRTPAPA